ncbi:hypothetical protein E4U48_000103 [Claviceps purpurea]|nr:hypothetical protein E4U28_000218 [Claviceps purpurea]KAG6279267.1 hypothetical protein E4U48_000103 [Claviceps purpurea]KAG6293273.1 hypothetical protein E4U46_007765 [Claviceps purpurea]
MSKSFNFSDGGWRMADTVADACLQTRGGQSHRPLPPRVPLHAEKTDPPAGPLIGAAEAGWRLFSNAPNRKNENVIT